MCKRNANGGEMKYVTVGEVNSKQRDSDFFKDIEVGYIELHATVNLRPPKKQGGRIAVSRILMARVIRTKF